MARKRTQDNRNLELIDALVTLGRDRGMPEDTVFEALEDALAAAYPKTPGVTAAHARVEVDRETGEFRVYEQEVDEETEEVLSETYVETPPELGRIAAQTAKQVIHQRLREAERDMTFEEYESREGDIVNGIVEQHDPRFVILSLGKAEAIMPHSEQIPRERYEVGDRVRAYIFEVRRDKRGPTIVVSRSHPGLVRRLFEMEVPEIGEGLVEVHAIAREGGHRTKIAVASKDPNIDPVGACVGPKGYRVRSVVNELRGEKIDIVAYSEDAAAFITEALSPARVRDVIVDEETKTAIVVVPDNQLSLAIGREGQNARLAARLTGWRIDIKSESQYQAGDTEPETDEGEVFEPPVPEAETSEEETEETEAGESSEEGAETSAAETPAEEPVPDDSDTDEPEAGTESTESTDDPDDPGPPEVREAT